VRRPSWKWYWLAVLATIILVALYVDRRDLPGRYEGWLQVEQAIKTREAEAAALKQQVETLRQRVEDLESDPVAQERAIRRWSRKLREDEQVFHIELPEDAVLLQPGDAMPVPEAGEQEAEPPH